jgi:uncharacterized membrane protein
MESNRVSVMGVLFIVGVLTMIVSGTYSIAYGLGMFRQDTGSELLGFLLVIFGLMQYFFLFMIIRALFKDSENDGIDKEIENLNL